MAATCLVVQPVHEAGVRRLEEAGVEVRYASAPDMETVVREIGDCEAVITRNAGLKTNALDAAPNLKVIANHGIGTNEIDVAHAGELGIPIIFTPNANACSVAEHAIAMMLALAKRLREGDAATRTGDWNWRYEGGMSEVSGKTLGLVGFGTIARLTAQMAKAGFGMHLIAWSPRASDDDLLAIGAARADSLVKLLAEADVVSLHRPLREDTRHTIDKAALTAMKSTAFLINTARGALVDEAALAAALKEGSIAGAGLDVFEKEPLPADSALRECPTAILAPHVAGATEDALRETAIQCAEQILDVLAGRRPPHLVNPEVWDRRRGLTEPV